MEPSNWNYTDNTQEFRAGKETVLILGLYSHCTSNVCLVFITRSENKHIIFIIEQCIVKSANLTLLSLTKLLSKVFRSTCISISGLFSSCRVNQTLNIIFRYM